MNFELRISDFGFFPHPPEVDPRRHEEIAKLSRSSVEVPTAGGPEPVGRAAAPNASVRSSASPHRPALSESAGVASRVDQRFAFEQVRTRRDRRAAGASAGTKAVWDERLRSEQAAFAPGVGDHQIAGVAAAPLRAPSSTQVPLLCVLRAFVVATKWTSVSSVPLWFLLRISHHPSTAPLRSFPGGRAENSKL